MNLNFTWEMNSFFKDKLVLNLEFSSPILISTAFVNCSFNIQTSDILEVTFLKHLEFTSLDKNYILPLNYKITKVIP